MNNNKKIEPMLEKYPFLAIVRYSDNEFVCVIQNQDSDVTTIYDYGSLKTEVDRRDFLMLADQWWWESNRLIPINIFLKADWRRFAYCAKTLISKEVEIVMGHCVRLDDLSSKRTKRKSIQLVRRVD
jgi:hypothetical protein